MSITIDVISCGDVFGGEGFKAQDPNGGRLLMYVKDHSGAWFTTNNKDWEPECEVLPNVTFNIVTKFKRRSNV
jgi:hypothetical protein|tara:strand:+ start:365 stop:583 length:219 start_codon:yes stop_codon:yes gene_type:complete